MSYTLALALVLVLVIAYAPNGQCHARMRCMHRDVAARPLAVAAWATAPRFDPLVEDDHDIFSSHNHATYSGWVCSADRLVQSHGRGKSNGDADERRPRDA